MPQRTPQTRRSWWWSCLTHHQFIHKKMFHLFFFLAVLITMARTNSSTMSMFVHGFQISPTTSTTRTLHRSPQHISSRRERRTMIQARNVNNKKDDDETTKKSGYTPISDGSPIGVAVVALGGAYVVFFGDQQQAATTTATDTTTLLLPEISVWTIFLTASLAAGIERLINLQRNNKKNKK